MGAGLWAPVRPGLYEETALRVEGNRPCPPRGVTPGEESRIIACVQTINQSWEGTSLDQPPPQFSRLLDALERSARHPDFVGTRDTIARCRKGIVPMLVLTRKLMEKLFIGDDICVTVVRLEGNQVRLGIEAPPDVSILRAELVPERPASHLHSRRNIE